jgi:hypothetical protein
LRLPLYPDLRDDDVDIVCSEIYKFFGHSRRMKGSAVT